MKNGFLKIGAAVALLSGVAQTADFNYTAYGGFIDNTDRGSSTPFTASYVDITPLVVDGNATYEEIWWGSGGNQSHLEVIEENGTISSDGNRRVLGTLVHYNQPISPPSLEKVDIAWHLNLQGQGPANDFNRTWRFELHNWETTNYPGSGVDCPRETNGTVINYADTDPVATGFQYLGDGVGGPPCSDAHDFVDYPDQNYTWIDSGTIYNIEITGFYDALGVLKQTFWAEENDDTNGTVQFAISEIGPATLTIGDRVWIDLDHDGFQDPSETAGINNVLVELYKANDDSLVDSVYTDANGLYEFVDVNSSALDGDYYLKFTSPVTDPDLRAFTTKYVFGATDAMEDANDSDVNASGFTDPFTLDMNTTNIDVGVKCGSIGDFIWIDKNQNGIQDAGEAGFEGMTVRLYKDGNTTAFSTVASGISGAYGFMPLGEGNYVVEFVLPTGYHFTSQGASTDDVDSDANVTDGRTRQIDVNLSTLGTSHFDNFDAGIYPEYNITKEVNETVAENGDLVMYTIRVTNNTERNASDVNVTEYHFPNPYMTWIDDNASHGSFNETTGEWVIGALAAGETAEMNLTVELDSNLSSLDNNACVISEQNIIPVCDQVNLTVISPAIDVEKSTNGQDADTGTGPVVLTGSTVTWEYNVTNTGDVNLSSISLSDDQEGAITCPSTTLVPGASMLCTETGTAALGQYENNATVTANSVTGSTVADNDLSHYLAEAPAIGVEKSTNGQDADTGTGPVVLTGSTVTWEYNITNTGDVNLSSISLTDDQEGAITCPSATLVPGASMICTETGTATLGQYENNASVIGVSPTGAQVADNDLSHYLAEAPAIDVEKSTNGQDADTAPGPIVDTGDPVTWEYNITNTGDVNLSSISLSDDREGTITCPSTTLVPGASMICTETSTAGAGEYENNATVTADSPTGAQVTDSDLSHYVSDAPAITVEKSTNGVDADNAGEGPVLIVGETVTWEYNITNTGDVNLTNISLTDDREGAITCPAGDLAPGASKICTHTGTVTQGEYENNASVEAMSIYTERTVTDSDLSHYTGIIGVNIGNFVWYDDDNNGIQDQGEDPVEGMTVTLLDENGTEITDINGTGSVQTDEFGAYNFFVRPGTYIIRFSPDDLPENYIFTQRNAGSEDEDSDADATTGESDPITVSRVDNYDVDAGIYCTCYDMEDSDSGSAMGTISATLMMLMTLMVGMYFVRREEQINQSRR